MADIKSKKGFSLNELLAVIAVMAILIGIGIPAAKAIMDSINSSAGLRNMIASCLSNARSIAIKEQKYAGIRFQSDTNGNQYIVFIINDEPATGLADGFRAVVGCNPIKLPGDGRVMDLVKVSRVDGAASQPVISENTIDDSDMIDEQYEIDDASAFSIVFSPAGKLVSTRVRIRNRDGIVDSTSNIGTDSSDKIFNKKAIVDINDAYLLYQDDYFGSSWCVVSENLGYGPELSRKSFIIYSKTKLEAAGDMGDYWDKYIKNLDMIYVNPYTGELVGGQLD